jgi:vitamin B12 transporter
VTTAATGNKAAFAELQSSFAERFFLVSNVRLDDHDTFGAHATWRVAPAFIVPGTDTKLKASYGTGFKAPTLYQLYVNSPSIGQVANPNLKPEVSKGYDFGFEQPLMNNRFRFGATYYRNDIKDLLVDNFVPATFTFTYFNIGRAQTQGVEAFATAAVTDQIKVRTDYTYTDARDADTGLRLLRRPADKISVAAIWTPLANLTVTTTFLSTSRPSIRRITTSPCSAASTTCSTGNTRIRSASSNRPLACSEGCVSTARAAGGTPYRETW